MPAQDPEWFGTGVMTEQPGSPHWELGEKASVTYTYRGQWALALASAPGKGTLGTGDAAGLLVARSTVVREQGGVGLLVITYEGIREDDVQVPSDDIDDGFEQQDFALEKHPNFADLDEDDILAAHNYAAAKDDEEAANYGWIFTEGSTQLQELARRLNRGFSHFKLDLPRLSWTTYWIDEPFLDAGGYFEIPGCPQSFDGGYDYIRLPDQRNWSNGFWRLTRSWQAVINPDTYIYPVP